MEIVFTSLNKRALLPKEEAGVLHFYSPEPIILQAGEFKKISTFLQLEALQGAALFLNTPPALLAKQITLFPGLCIQDPGELNIVLQNRGKDQINLLPETEVATGRLLRTEDLILVIQEGKSPEIPKKMPVPRKGAGFKFEVTRRG